MADLLPPPYAKNAPLPPPYAEEPFLFPGDFYSPTPQQWESNPRLRKILGSVQIFQIVFMIVIGCLWSLGFLASVATSGLASIKTIKVTSWLVFILFAIVCINIKVWECRQLAKNNVRPTCRAILLHGLVSFVWILICGALVFITFAQAVVSPEYWPHFIVAVVAIISFWFTFGWSLAKLPESWVNAENLRVSDEEELIDEDDALLGVQGVIVLQ